MKFFNFKGNISKFSPNFTDYIKKHLYKLRIEIIIEGVQDFSFFIIIAPTDIWKKDILNLKYMLKIITIFFKFLLLSQLYYI